MSFEIDGHAWTYHEAGWNSEVVHGRIVATGPEVVTIETRDGELKAIRKCDARPGRPPSYGAESACDYFARVSVIFNRERDVERLKTEAQRLGLTVVPT